MLRLRAGILVSALSILTGCATVESSLTLPVTSVDPQEMAQARATLARAGLAASQGWPGWDDARR